MRYTLVLLFALFLITSCDDGDVLNINLEFDTELEVCTNDVNNYTVYDIRTEPAESLSLVFPRSTENNLIFVPEVSPYERSFSIDNANVFFNYRTYNQTPIFCTTIPDSEIIILEDYQAASGAEVKITTTFVDSDDDGIPNEDEDTNEDGDNNYLTNPTDTDGDGLPNYIDQDDDNDNVLTIDEDDDDDGDGNPFTNFRDTDGDGNPDYLEEDDDNDGVITRLEDEDENRNPENDFLTDDPLELPRYRNPEAAQEFAAPIPEFRIVNYTRRYVTTFIIENLDLEIISDNSLEFGTFVRTTDPISYDNN